ncbi:MAG: right-handed parallel beta-helix repeat-containing protein [Thermoplasmatales archaeon]|nr:right-handed parallel beta-helix repeat-containing protein [Thermoplasmatales archaeon]
MNMKKAVIIWIGIALVLSGIIVFVGIGSAGDNVNEVNEISVSSARTLSSHAPIYIDGNADFSDADDDGVSNPSAAGTEDDPYIIEGWDINASTANGIDIRNTNKYFIIRNGTIHDGKSNDKHGIYFYSVTNGRIDNVTSYNNSNGIYLDSSSDNDIINNTASNNYFGILLLNSSYSNGENNTANNNTGVAGNGGPPSTGILVAGSHNTIRNNRLQNNTNGILVTSGDPNNPVEAINNTISSNNASYNDYGIAISGSNNNQITNCTVYNNSEYGIFLVSSSDNNIINNIALNNMGGIFTGNSINNNIINNTASNNYLGIVLSNSSYSNVENNTANNNTGLAGNGGPISTGILVMGSHNTIRNNRLQNNTNGILVAPGDPNNPIETINNTISNCTVYNNDDGIYLYSSSNNNITNCSVYNNSHGIWLGSSSNNQISNCTVYNNSNHGIELYESSNNNQITNCTAYNNHYDGICLYYSSNNTITNCAVYDNSDEGIMLGDSSNNNQITNCTAYNNDGWGGIYLDSSSNNQITNCAVYNNDDYGIYLDSSSNNEIYYNNIYNNTNYGVYNYNSETEYQANATYNWWGSADGPSGVGPGSGDAVSDNVIYDPWLIEEYHHPLIRITSPQGGLITNQNVTLIYTIDIPLTSTDSPIEHNIGGPANNTTYTDEKVYNITISVTDGAGSTATANVAFTIDKTKPAIDITGVVNNTYYNVSVTAIIEVFDLNLNTSTITLNEESFASGTIIADDDDYVLFVEVSDKAGNTAQKTVSFTVDKTQPSIEVTGVANDAYYNISVTPVIDITDLNLNTSLTVITLNDGLFTSGSTVIDEGNYVLFVQATDKAGNTVTKTVAFTIDKAEPTVNVAGVEDGAYYNVSVTPTFWCSDVNLDAVSATLNDETFINDTAVQDDGSYTLFVLAMDKAGNTASKTVSFIIDKTLPEITVTGVADNAHYNISITPIVDITDLNLNTTLVELNDASFTSGTEVINEDDYVLFVLAMDKAGNVNETTISFVIDKTKPVLKILSPENNVITNQSIILTYSVSDNMDDEDNLTLSILNGTTYIKEGDYTVTVSASDRAGNKVSETVSFTIDKINPIINITGVADDSYYNTDIMPVIEITDIHLNITSITLNDNPFTNGTTVSAENTYTLVVQADDKAGNTAIKTISFIIDKTAPIITITSPKEGLITNQDVTLEYLFSDNVSSAENITVTGDESPYTEEGNYSIMLTATDQAGNTAQDTVTFIIDKTKPIISDVTPSTGEKTTEKTITVSGKTEPDATVKINNVEVAVGADGSFSREITLTKGANVITITATDQAGNTNTEMITITYQPKKEEKGFIPGFETFIVIIILGGCAILLKNRKRFQ